MKARVLLAIFALSLFAPAVCAQERVLAQAARKDAKAPRLPAAAPRPPRASSSPARRPSWPRRPNTSTAPPGRATPTSPWDTVWLETRGIGRAGEPGGALCAPSGHASSRVTVDPVTRRKLDLLKRGGRAAAAEPRRRGSRACRARDQPQLGLLDRQVHAQRQGDEPRRAVEHMAPRATPPRSRRVGRLAHRLAAHERRLPAWSRSATKARGARLRGRRRDVASRYDMPPDALPERIERLWAQVEPLYKDLHCYVRGRLNANYGDAVQPRTGPIRADLLGNMWAQDWGNIYDIVAPQGAGAPATISPTCCGPGLRRRARWCKTGERFYTSLGLAAARHLLGALADRQARATATWSATPRPGTSTTSTTCASRCASRSTPRTSTPSTTSSATTIYQRAYNEQPFLFRDGANDGFHEAIGDFVALSSRPNIWCSSA